MRKKRTMFDVGAEAEAVRAELKRVLDVFEDSIPQERSLFGSAWSNDVRVDYGDGSGWGRGRSHYTKAYATIKRARSLLHPPARGGRR